MQAALARASLPGQPQPSGQVCYQVQNGTDVWYTTGNRFTTVCRQTGTAPGFAAVTPPPRLAQLPRR